MSLVVSWRYLSFIQLPLTQRKFCQSCQQLLLPVDWGEHGEHQLLSDISITQLRRPSQLLYPLENKKTHAQYLFTDRSCQFLAGLLATLGFRRVLCVGTPRYGPLFRSPRSTTLSLQTFCEVVLYCAEWGVSSGCKRTWKVWPLREFAAHSPFERRLVVGWMLSDLRDFSVKVLPFKKISVKLNWARFSAVFHWNVWDGRRTATGFVWWLSVAFVASY